jgi:hypothetical protein
MSGLVISPTSGGRGGKDGRNSPLSCSGVGLSLDIDIRGTSGGRGDGNGDAEGGLEAINLAAGGFGGGGGGIFARLSASETGEAADASDASSNICLEKRLLGTGIGGLCGRSSSEGGVLNGDNRSPSADLATLTIGSKV